MRYKYIFFYLIKKKDSDRSVGELNWGGRGERSTKERESSFSRNLLLKKYKQEREVRNIKWENEKVKGLYFSVISFFLFKMEEGIKLNKRETPFIWIINLSIWVISALI